MFAQHLLTHANNARAPAETLEAAAFLVFTAARVRRTRLNVDTASDLCLDTFEPRHKDVMLELPFFAEMIRQTLTFGRA